MAVVANPLQFVIFVGVLVTTLLGATTRMLEEETGKTRYLSFFINYIHKTVQRRTVKSAVVLRTMWSYLTHWRH